MYSNAKPTGTEAPGGVPQQIGRYQIIRRIGKGGMGVVFEAIHIPLQRKVALKMLRPIIADDKQFLERFYREIRALGSVLDNRHVVLATDGGEENGVPFLTMEFIEGLDLDRLLAACGGTLSVGQASEMMRQAAIGLEGIHQHGLVHRDLKPTNLIRTPQGIVKILDLGLARLCENEDNHSEITPDYGFLGTLDFQAPEQAVNPHAVDIRADIYSLGCTFFKLLTGRAPYYQFERFAKIRAHATEPIPELPASIPDGIQDIVRKMLAKNREERFQTPTEVAAALAPFADQDSALTICYAPAQELALRTPIPGTTPAHSDIPTESVFGEPTPADGTVAPPAPALSSGRKRLRILGALLVAGFIGVAAYFTANALFSPRPPLSLDELKPLETHFLLDKKPQAVLWTPKNPISNFHFEPRKLSVSRAANEDSLFLLGEVTAPSYELQMRIFQPEWTSGVGIVLGYREVVHPYPLFVNSKNMVFGEFQLLRFQRIEKKDKSIDLCVSRCRAKHFRKPSGQEGVSADAQTADCVPLLFNQHTVTVVVENSRLKKVYVEGLPEWKKLTTPQWDKEFGPESHQGRIGVWVNGTHAVFSDAGFRLLGK